MVRLAVVEELRVFIVHSTVQSVCLLRLVVDCTVTVRVSVTCCPGGPPPAVVHFLTRMTRERVTLRSTAAALLS
jgi:hypothetical protein